MALVGAGAAEGAGAQHVVGADVPAGDGHSITPRLAALPLPAGPFQPGLLLLPSKNYLILHCHVPS